MRVSSLPKAVTCKTDRPRFEPATFRIASEGYRYFLSHTGRYNAYNIIAYAIIKPW